MVVLNFVLHVYRIYFITTGSILIGNCKTVLNPTELLMSRMRFDYSTLRIHAIHLFLKMNQLVVDLYTVYIH